MLLIVAASTLFVAAAPRMVQGAAAQQTADGATPGAGEVPTVAVFEATPVAVPTVSLPRPTATARPKPRRHKARRRQRVRKTAVKPAPPHQTWILAYLTSYCPGSAGWISSSGAPVFYGMLANDYYAFGTRVYIPVLGIVGVVEDHLADASWNHFDVWSPTCYSTPTGWFRVAVQS